MTNPLRELHGRIEQPESYSDAYFALADTFDGPRGLVPGVRIQTRRNSLHMPLDQFLAIAQQVIASQGALVLLPAQMQALEALRNAAHDRR